jgi:hypothetical protein
MQGVGWREHLSAPVHQEPMQGVRRGEHLPAPAHQEQMQGVPSADNKNIAFLPSIVSTSTRMQVSCMANFCVFFFYRPTGRLRHFTDTGMPPQRNQSDSFRFKRVAFYQSLKSTVGLAAAKAAALRINLNVEGCGIVAAPVHAPSYSRAPLLLPRDGQTSPHRPRLVVPRSTCPPLSPSHANSFIISTAVVNTDTHTQCKPQGKLRKMTRLWLQRAPVHGPPQKRQKTVFTVSATPVSGDAGGGAASGTNRTIATAVGVPTSHLCTAAVEWRTCAMRDDEPRPVSPHANSFVIVLQY